MRKEKKKGQNMTREEKSAWMAVWAAKHDSTLVLEGECGIGRPCVGISVHDTYPSYEWTDKEGNRIDYNGDVWRPQDAYHKHPCVAVLGHGEEAEEQLYNWLHWFDKHGFEIEVSDAEKPPGGFTIYHALLGQLQNVRMVRRTP